MAQEQNIFDYHDYKSYLQAKVGVKSARKGLKSALAAALSCQPTYISQILNGNAHLSLEQASDVNEFFAHSRDEGHFFLLLLQRDRAGKQALKKYFTEQIGELLDRRLNLVKRLGAQNSLSEADKLVFYSSWHYLAIHLALTVPELQTKEALIRSFGLSARKLNDVLEFLTSTGLARQVGVRFEADSTLLRIGSDSPHIVRHHSNWRMKALESLDREDVNDLHYSAVVSLSRTDVRRVKNLLLENIKEYVGVIRASSEEEVYVLNLDFFNLLVGGV